MTETNKARVFIDSNVMLSFLQGEKEVKGLFSKKLLAKVQYTISPVVYQELLFITRSMVKKNSLKTRAGLRAMRNHVKIITNESSTIDVDSKTLQNLRNQMIHTNDLTILQTALKNCDLLLTKDQHLLQVNKLANLEIISPEHYFQRMEAKP